MSMKYLNNHKMTQNEANNKTSAKHPLFFD